MRTPRGASRGARGSWIVLTCAAMLLSVCASANAQWLAATEQPSEASAIVSVDPGVGRVTLDVSGVPLPEVLRLLADQADLVLAGIDLPQIPVTLRVHDIDADSALRLIFSGTPYDALRGGTPSDGLRRG